MRELRQHASRWLGRVAQGESFEVTDRGRAVARLVPLPTAHGLQSLVDSGRARLPRSRLSDLPPPAPLVPGAMTGSEALALLRSDER